MEPNGLEQLEQLKEELSKDSYTDEADRRSPKHLWEEFFYSLIIALVPTFISIVAFIYYHQDTPLGIAGWCLLGFLVLFTALIFLFRQVASKKFLKIIALVFLGALFVINILITIDSVIVCKVVGGTSGYYHSYQGVVHDINGNLVTQIGGNGFVLDTVCYIPKEKVSEILSHHSIFYDSATFIAQ